MGKATLCINTADLNTEFLSEKHYDGGIGKERIGKEPFSLLFWRKVA